MVESWDLPRVVPWLIGLLVLCRVSRGLMIALGIVGLNLNSGSHTGMMVQFFNILILWLYQLEETIIWPYNVSIVAVWLIISHYRVMHY